MRRNGSASFASDMQLSPLHRSKPGRHSTNWQLPPSHALIALVSSQRALGNRRNRSACRAAFRSRCLRAGHSRQSRLRSRSSRRRRRSLVVRIAAVVDRADRDSLASEHGPPSRAVSARSSRRTRRSARRCRAWLRSRRRRGRCSRPGRRCSSRSRTCRCRSRLWRAWARTRCRSRRSSTSELSAVSQPLLAFWSQSPNGPRHCPTAQRSAVAAGRRVLGRGAGARAAAAVVDAAQRRLAAVARRSRRSRRRRRRSA